MKERALTQAMMASTKGLDSLVDWCTTDNAGRLVSPGMTAGHIRRSAFQRGKFKKCRNYGGPIHGDGSRTVREKECRAFGNTCNK